MSQPIRTVAYSRDGMRLAAGGEWSPVFLWNIAEHVANEPESLPLPEPTSWIGFSPDGRTLAAANLDGTVRLFDLSSRTILAELRGHVMGVLRAEFFPDGKTLVSGSLDGRVKLWNLATYQEMLTLTTPLGGTFHSLCIDPEGKTLAVGYMGFPGHHVRLFRAPSLDEIAATEKARTRVTR